jgi:hypothetical protein
MMRNKGGKTIVANVVKIGFQATNVHLNTYTIAKL